MILTILSASCATEVSKTVCPTIVSYSKEFQNQVADELRNMGKSNAQIKVLLEDYMKLRKACRSLEK